MNTELSAPPIRSYVLMLTESEAHAVGYSLRHTQSIIRRCDYAGQDKERLLDMSDRLESAYRKLDTCEIVSTY